MSQQILQALKDNRSNSMKNFMPVNLTTQIKWINFLEDINYQKLFIKK